MFLSWQRRDNGAGSSTKDYPPQQTGRKQRYRSFSRSRSRSPAESYYSRRSSRGRSPTPEPARYRRRPDSRGPPPRSLSPVDRWSRNNQPKRRFTPSPSLSPPRRGHSPPFDDRPKRDSSPPPRYYSPQRPARNVGPVNHGYRKKVSPSPSPPRRHPFSPGPPPRRHRSRGRSPSSVTNTSRSRSRSRSVSPHRNASKTVHRLPAVTSTDLRWTEPRISSPPPQTLQPPQREQRNGGGPEKLSKAEVRHLPHYYITMSSYFVAQSAEAGGEDREHEGQEGRARTTCEDGEGDRGKDRESRGPRWPSKYAPTTSSCIRLRSFGVAYDTFSSSTNYRCWYKAQERWIQADRAAQRIPQAVLSW